MNLFPGERHPRSVPQQQQRLPPSSVGLNPNVGRNPLQHSAPQSLGQPSQMLSPLPGQVQQLLPLMHPGLRAQQVPPPNNALNSPSDQNLGSDPTKLGLSNNDSVLGSNPPSHALPHSLQNIHPSLKKGVLVAHLLFSDLCRGGGGKNLFLNQSRTNGSIPQNVSQAYFETLLNQLSGIVENTFTFLEACGCLNELAGRVEEMINLMRSTSAKGLMGLILALGDVLIVKIRESERAARRSKEEDKSQSNLDDAPRIITQSPLAQALLSPTFPETAKAVDKSMLRLVESVLMPFCSEDQALGAFLERLLAAGLVPKFAHRRIGSAVNICVFAVQRGLAKKANNANNPAASTAVNPRLPQNSYFKKHPTKAGELVEKVLAPTKNCVVMKSVILEKLRDIVGAEKFLAASGKIGQGMKLKREEMSVEMYGSAVNGFETKDSDIDCTLIVPAEAIQSGAFSIREKCGLLRQLLPQAGFVDVQIIEARVPLVKFRAPDGNFLDIRETPGGRKLQRGVAIDLTFNNLLGFENSKLLKSYSTCPSCRNLGVLVKVWAKSRGIIDAQNGMLSSYVYMLLVIFFLQVKKGILPSLQRGVAPTGGSATGLVKSRKYLCHEVGYDKEWNGNRGTDYNGRVFFVDTTVSNYHLRFETNNVKPRRFGGKKIFKSDPKIISAVDFPLHKLLHEFFHFYAYEFNFYRDVVSIRAGRGLDKLHLLSTLLKKWEDHRIQVASYSAPVQWSCPLFLTSSNNASNTSDATLNGPKFGPRACGLLVEDPFELGQIKSATYLGVEKLCYEFQRAAMIMGEVEDAPLLKLFGAESFEAVARGNADQGFNPGVQQNGGTGTLSGTGVNTFSDSTMAEILVKSGILSCSMRNSNHISNSSSSGENLSEQDASAPPRTVIGNPKSTKPDSGSSSSSIRLAPWAKEELQTPSPHLPPKSEGKSSPSRLTPREQILEQLDANGTKITTSPKSPSTPNAAFQKFKGPLSISFGAIPLQLRSDPVLNANLASLGVCVHGKPPQPVHQEATITTTIGNKEGTAHALFHRQGNPNPISAAHKARNDLAAAVSSRLNARSPPFVPQNASPPSVARQAALQAEVDRLAGEAATLNLQTLETTALDKKSPLSARGKLESSANSLSPRGNSISSSTNVGHHVGLNSSSLETGLNQNAEIQNQNGFAMLHSPLAGDLRISSGTLNVNISPMKRVSIERSQNNPDASSIYSVYSESDKGLDGSLVKEDAVFCPPYEFFPREGEGTPLSYGGRQNSPTNSSGRNQGRFRAPPGLAAPPGLELEESLSLDYENEELTGSPEGFAVNASPPALPGFGELFSAGVLGVKMSSASAEEEGESASSCGVNEYAENEIDERPSTPPPTYLDQLLSLGEERSPLSAQEESGLREVEEDTPREGHKPLKEDWEREFDTLVESEAERTRSKGLELNNRERRRLAKLEKTLNVEKNPIGDLNQEEKDLPLNQEEKETPKSNGGKWETVSKTAKKKEKKRQAKEEKRILRAGGEVEEENETPISGTAAGKKKKNRNFQ